MFNKLDETTDFNFLSNLISQTEIIYDVRNIDAMVLAEYCNLDIYQKSLQLLSKPLKEI